MKELFINFFVRMIIGIAVIFLVNEFLVTKDIDMGVGINPVTVATAGVLGVPGVCLLYGIVLYDGF